MWVNENSMETVPRRKVPKKNWAKDALSPWLSSIFLWAGHRETVFAHRTVVYVCPSPTWCPVNGLSPFLSLDQLHVCPNLRPRPPESRETVAGERKTFAGDRPVADLNILGRSLAA